MVEQLRRRQRKTFAQSITRTALCASVRPFFSLIVALSIEEHLRYDAAQDSAIAFPVAPELLLWNPAVWAIDRSRCETHFPPNSPKSLLLIKVGTTFTLKMISNAFMPLTRKESDLVLPTTATYYPNLATFDSESKGGLLDWIRYPARRKHLLRIILLCGAIGCWVFVQEHGPQNTQGMQDWNISDLTAGKAEASVIKDDPSPPAAPIPATIPPSKTAMSLVQGLIPLEKNSPNLTVHSVLGEEAENAYVYGSQTLEDYYNSLSTFIDLAMPQYLRSKLRTSLDRYTDNRHPQLFLKAGRDRLPALGEEAGTKNI